MHTHCSCRKQYQIFSLIPTSGASDHQFCCITGIQWLVTEMLFWLEPDCTSSLFLSLSLSLSPSAVLPCVCSFICTALASYFKFLCLSACLGESSTVLPLNASMKISLLTVCCLQISLPRCANTK